MEPLVSIITAAYNSGKTIDETIRSVIRQDFGSWEMIIVDDASTDNTVELIENHINNDSRIKLIRNRENMGPAMARNRGLQEAVGRYIAFIDSDDLWLEHLLSRTITLMEKEHLPFVFSSYQRISENGTKNFGSFIVPARVDYDKLLKTNYISCLTAVYDSEIIGKRYFETKMPIFEDYYYWLTILKDGYTAYGQQEVLACYRIRRGSVSRDKRDKYKYIWAIHDRIDELPLWRKIYLIICYMLYGVKKNYPFIFMK